MNVVVEAVPPGQAPPDLLTGIRRLLDAAFGGDFTEDDWDHTTGGWHVVAFFRSRVVGHVAVVPRVLEIDGRAFDTGYVEGVAVLPQVQGQGIGTRVMADVEELIDVFYEVGALSTDRPSFYERLGWERWRGPTFVRDGDELIRTPDEDGGVLVRRTGPASSEIDLAAPIACFRRGGDDW